MNDTTFIPKPSYEDYVAVDQLARQMAQSQLK
jgi:hypothetical protein